MWPRVRKFICCAEETTVLVSVPGRCMVPLPVRRNHLAFGLPHKGRIGPCVEPFVCSHECRLSCRERESALTASHVLLGGLTCQQQRAIRIEPLLSSLLICTDGTTRLCLGPSYSHHFGAPVCRAYSGFFRRSVLPDPPLVCIRENASPVKNSGKDGGRVLQNDRVFTCRLHVQGWNAQLRCDLKSFCQEICEVLRKLQNVPVPSTSAQTHFGFQRR